ncbi:MAG: FAD-binding oxidoreductase, partial [Lysobacter sp.]|nr:FAD-binding oxidoreductase [Lysobacter sp.]
MIGSRIVAALHADKRTKAQTSETPCARPFHRPALHFAPFQPQRASLAFRRPLLRRQPPACVRHHLPSSQLLAIVADALGPDRVADRGRARLKYPAETHFSQVRAQGALRPQSVDEVATCLAAANQLRVPLYPISTGNNWGYGAASPTAGECVILDLGALNRIRAFDPDSGVVTLEPGVTQQQLFEFLDQHGYPFLVPVTGAGPNCSIVGNALERGYGITPCADHFLAVTNVEVMLADGSLYRSPLSAMGADKVAGLFKWHIGPYLDGIFTQSGFGIVTAMSIALAKKAESMECFLFSLKDETRLEPAIIATRDILTSLPGLVGGINLMNRHRMLAMSAPYPRDQLGPDGLIPEAVVESIGRTLQIFPWTGYGTLYGTRATAGAARSEIRKRLRGIASRLMFFSPAHTALLSRVVRHAPAPLRRRLGPLLTTLTKSLELLTGRPNETALPLAYWRSGTMPTGVPLNPARDGCGLAWFAPLVPMDPQSVREFVRFTTTALGAHRLEPLITLTSVNNRCFDSTVPLLFDPQVPSEVERVRQAHEQLLASALAHGFAPYRVGNVSMDW